MSYVMRELSPGTEAAWVPTSVLGGFAAAPFAPPRRPRPRSATPTRTQRVVRSESRLRLGARSAPKRCPRPGALSFQGLSTRRLEADLVWRCILRALPLAVCLGLRCVGQTPGHLDRTLRSRGLWCFGMDSVVNSMMRTYADILIDAIGRCRWGSEVATSSAVANATC